MPAITDAPLPSPRQSGKWPALVLAIAVHAVFLAVLVFSVRWTAKKPEPVFAELYAPPTKAAAVEPPRPVPPPPPPPPPPLQPQVEPEPTVVAKAQPKPPEAVAKPDPRAAEIAMKAKQEEDRRRREQIEQEQREAARKELERRENDRKRQDEQKRVAEARERQQRESEALKAQAQRESRERQTREAESLKAQAQRETQTRMAQQAEREAQQREQERLGQERAQQAAAFGRAEADYIRRIQAKVRGNLIEPGELVGNPEAHFEVVQLPTGEIIDVKLIRSSGLRAYDDAVERAIRKSSPLPRPSQPEIWQRELKLRVRPRD